MVKNKVMEHIQKTWMVEMTDEEIYEEMEKEAKEYAQGNFYSEQGFIYGYERGFAKGRKEKELSYIVGKVTKAELNKCKTIEEKMEWLGKVLGYAIFKNDMNYVVWVNVQKNNIIENLEKENEALRQSEQESQEIIAELNAKLKNIDHYLAYDIPHELMNEATTKIWHML